MALDAVPLMRTRACGSPSWPTAQRRKAGYVYADCSDQRNQSPLRTGRAIRCQSPTPSGSPCLQCAACEAFDQSKSGFNHTEVNCAELRLDGVQAILDGMRACPFDGRWRVALFDEAQEATPKMFSALLKELEEPRPWAVFIFMTTAPEELPPTIRSRCPQFSFKLLDFETSVAHLQDMCTRERISYEPNALALLAEIAR